MDQSQVFRSAREASRKLSQLSSDVIGRVLRQLAEALVYNTDYLLEENEKDLARMSPEDTWYDRLQLTRERIASISRETMHVAELPDPLGIRLMEKKLPSNLQLSKITVPIGVIGIIYEARPNVTIDAFVLCFKTGNAVILKGGSNASFSNQAFVGIIKKVLADHQIDPHVVTLLPPERSSTGLLLEAVGWVDLVIPRGSQQLINYVREHAKVPVIETGAGIVHTYFDETGDLQKGAEIICNAKTRRVSVCNALDCLIIHEKRLAQIGLLLQPLAERSVVLYADEHSYEALAGNYPAKLLNRAEDRHFGTEFLAMKMAVKTVANLEEALDHITRYGSKHSEAIISEDGEHIDHFLRSVDAAAVYANASTAFTDGAEFGLGAEIGISTQKLHARGPMALEALTSYKWIVRGNGQVRK